METPTTGLCLLTIVGWPRRQQFSETHTPLFVHTSMTEQFDTKPCADWSFSLLCATLEHLLTGEQKKALVSVLAVRNEYTCASALTPTVEATKTMERKCNFISLLKWFLKNLFFENTHKKNTVKSALCVLGADAAEFDRYADSALTKESVVALRLDRVMNEQCEELLRTSRGIMVTDPLGAVEYCAKGLLFAGLITPDMEDRLSSLRELGRQASDKPAEPNPSEEEEPAAAPLTDAWSHASMLYDDDRLHEACLELWRALPLQTAAKRKAGAAKLAQWFDELYQRASVHATALAYAGTLSFGALRLDPTRTTPTANGLRIDKDSLGVVRTAEELEQLEDKGRAWFLMGHEALREEDLVSAKK